MSDYLAIFYIGGGSSHGRADSIDKAVQLCLNAASDWASMFDIDGKPAKFSIYDVEGFENIYWDYEVRANGRAEPFPLLEVRDVVLSAKPQWDEID